MINDTNSVMKFLMTLTDYFYYFSSQRLRSFVCGFAGRCVSVTNIILDFTITILKIDHNNSENS